jgi:hypothetical protein
MILYSFCELKETKEVDKDKEIRTLNLTIDEFKNTNDSII